MASGTLHKTLRTPHAARAMTARAPLRRTGHVSDKTLEHVQTCRCWGIQSEGEIDDEGSSSSSDSEQPAHKVLEVADDVLIEAAVGLAALSK